ncbi:MAG: FlgD immunoglobulin-like domain containing protein, partial [Armatimonadota bacterium]|nr:FlgD immunoglobulin-like domain containing protein [Armatimonadota bacterium]
QAPRAAELVFPNLAYLPRTATLMLYDHQTGRAVPLRGRNRYRFEVPAEGGVFQFRVQLARSQAPLRILQPVVQGGRAAGEQFTIQATLTAPAYAQVQIVAAGRAVRTLSPQFLRSAGILQTTWDGRDDSGRALPPGTYLVQITAQTDDGQVARATIPLILTR